MADLCCSVPMEISHQPVPMAVDESVVVPAEPSMDIHEGASSLVEPTYVRMTEDGTRATETGGSLVGRESSLDRLSDAGCLSSECSADEVAEPGPGLAVALVAVVEAASHAHCEVEAEELAERLALMGSWELLERSQVARSERTARDELRRARALYFRSALVTTHQRGFGPTVWPRHHALPPASVFLPRQYSPNTPTARSCLRRPRSLGSESESASTSTGSSMDEMADVDFCEATPPRRRRRVVVTDEIGVQAGPELVETDGELASAAWRCISFYAPVRQMVMQSLKARYGADAADNDAWMSSVEEFAWLDDIFCTVKDAYQHVHNEEASAFAAIMEEFRSAPTNAWWSRLGSWF